MPRGKYIRKKYEDGKAFSLEVRKRMNNSKRGKKLSEKHKQKISISLKGKPPTKTSFKKGHLINKGHKHSETIRKTISQALKGEKSYRWKGGITPINAKIRHSLEYKLWREAIFKRDNWTCIWCKIKGIELNADHIKSFSQYPELRFAIDNGRTLCESCHRKTDNFGSKAYG